jgi:DNA-directed RNA polymerase subunit RPC12/RpoP
MNIGISQAVTQPLVLAIKMEGECTICGTGMIAHATSGLASYTCMWSCPAKMHALYQEELEHRERRINCPKCPGRIAVNRNDLYECVQCQSLYTCGDSSDESWEHTFLIDERRDTVIPVRVLRAKGGGEFPVEKELKLLVKNAWRAFQRMDRLLRGMRRHLGIQKIFFDGQEFVARDYDYSLEEATQVMLRSQKYCLSVTPF